MSTPPPVFERLLLRVIGRDGRGRSMAGDLREEHAQRPAGVRNDIRYALACLRLAVQYVPSRVAEAARRSGSAGMLDLRQSARGFRDSPSYWLGCALTLALGIGAATTIGTVVYGALL